MTTNAKNLQQDKGRFCLIRDQILTFALSTNLVRQVKNLPLNFKQIALTIFCAMDNSQLDL